MPCQEAISVIATNFKQPIAVLADCLRRVPARAASASLPTAVERDYSTTLVLLVVVMFEAYLGRVRHFDQHTPRGRQSGYQYFERLPGRRSKKLLQRIEECFVLRDVIAHGHVWVEQHCWTQGNASFLDSATLDLRLYGDRRYLSRVRAKVIDAPHRHIRSASPRTKTLGLHVEPTAIDRKDVRRVLHAVVDGLRWLERRNHLGLPVGYIDNVRVRFNNQLSFRFVEIAEQL